MGHWPLACRNFPSVIEESSMRPSVFLPFLFIASATQASELHVGAGEEYYIEQSELRLTRLVLEDGAVLRVKPGLGTLRLSAEQAWIGQGVQILAMGSDAAPARSAYSAAAPAVCNVAPAGAAGLPGES